VLWNVVCQSGADTAASTRCSGVNSSNRFST
jgi:hypothetical protein